MTLIQPVSSGVNGQMWLTECRFELTEMGAKRLLSMSTLRGELSMTASTNGSSTKNMFDGVTRSDGGGSVIEASIEDSHLLDLNACEFED